MKTVGQILNTKGYDVWTIDQNATVYDALKLMAEKNVGALVALKDQSWVGIFSERDYARKIILEGKHSQDTLVKEVMSENPICCSPEMTIEECMTLMTERHIRHLPVADGNRHVGLISIGDVVKAIMVEQQGTISDLSSYITGTR